MKELYKRYEALRGILSDIEKARSEMICCYERGGKILLAGNGGSAADCDHIVGELMKGFLMKRPLTSTQKEKMQPNEKTK